MFTILSQSLIQSICTNYPSTLSQQLADELGISIHQLNRVARKYGLKKNNEYLKEMYHNLQVSKQQEYHQRKVNYTPTEYQMNILVGSLLGDGSLSRYGRSVEFAYREHGATKQADYRHWKSQQLSSLDFKFSPNHLYPSIRSPSHKLYTNFHSIFYSTGKKSITKSVLDLIDEKTKSTYSQG